jgi:hypothetical protein
MTMINLVESAILYFFVILYDTFVIEIMLILFVVILSFHSFLFRSILWGLISLLSMRLSLLFFCYFTLLCSSFKSFCFKFVSKFTLRDTDVTTWNFTKVFNNLQRLTIGTSERLSSLNIHSNIKHLGIYWNHSSPSNNL